MKVGGHPEVQRGPVIATAAALLLCGMLGGHILLDAESLSNDEPVLTAVAGGQSLPTLSHLLIALPVLGAFLYALLKFRVVSTPLRTVAILIAALTGLYWASAAFSRYPGPALTAAAEWTTYSAVFLTIIATAGRRGAGFILLALAGAGLLSALLALRQFGEMRGFDPNYRVQGPWNNPNALGAFLVMSGLSALAGLGVLPRVGKLVTGVGIALLLVALTLTASKGAFLALAVGGVSWILLSVALKVPNLKWSLLAALLAVLLAGALVKLATRSPESSTSAGGGLSRVTNSAEASQSVGFRRLLWRSAAELAREEPLNGGLQSFGPRSSKPGLVTQTGLAHSTPLQLASELTPMGGILFILFFGACLVQALPGARSLSAERKGVLVSALSALLAGVFHNFIDSDAYYFGLGFPLFALAGIVLVSSCDATAPELVPISMRRLGASLIAALVALWSFLGWADLQVAAARGAVKEGRLTEALATTAMLRSWTPWDPRPYAIAARIESDPQAALASARAAFDRGPSAKAARLVATLCLRAGNTAGAIAACEQALRLDPNNFAALEIARDAATAAGDEPTAESYARRTIAIEGTTYATVRSLPEFIPTAIAEARLFLAKRATGEDRTEHLLKAVRDFSQYARTTVPMIARYGDATMGGESKARAESVLKMATQAAQELLRELPPSDHRRGEVAGALADFAAAAARLRSDSK